MAILFHRAVEAQKAGCTDTEFNNLVIEALEREVPVDCANVRNIVRRARMFLIENLDRMWTLTNNNPAYLVWAWVGGVYATRRPLVETAATREVTILQGRIRLFTASLQDALLSIEVLAEMWGDVVTQVETFAVLGHLECMVWHRLLREAAGVHAPNYRDMSTACVRLICMRRECIAYRSLSLDRISDMTGLCERSASAHRIIRRVRTLLSGMWDDGGMGGLDARMGGGSHRDMAGALACLPGDVYRVALMQASMPTAVGAAFATRIIRTTPAVRVLQRFAVAVSGRCDMCKDCVAPRSSLWTVYTEGPSQVCTSARGLPVLVHVNYDAWFVISAQDVTLHSSVDDALVEWVLRTNGMVTP